MNASNLRPASQIAARLGVKSIAYGDPGTGKTPVFMTAPRPILLLCEPGARSLSKATNLPTWQAYEYPQIEEFFKWWFSSREVDQFDTLGVDSVSHMAEVVLKHMLKVHSHGLKAYGEMSNKVMEYMNALFYQPNKHMYLICKQTRIEENGVLKRKPYFPGNDLNVKIPHLFDLIMHLGLHNIPGVMGPQKAFCTSEQFDLLARDRSGNLATFEPPNLTDIFTKAML
jgi:hypothetical protein